MDGRLLELNVLDGVIPARQSRSRDAQQRLLKAGEEVFAKLGYDAAHVSDIAAAANVSIGSFYRRFRDKEALFRALQTEFALRGLANIDRFFDMPKWRDASVEELVHTLVRNTARVIDRRPGFFRALYQRSIAGAPVTELPALRHADDYAGRRLAAFLRSKGASDRPDLDEACIFALKAVEAVLIQRLILAPEGRGAASPPRLVDSLRRLLCGYLGIATS